MKLRVHADPRQEPWKQDHHAGPGRHHGHQKHIRMEIRMDKKPLIIRYSIGIATPVTPEVPLPPLPKIPRGSLVVVEGRAPIWRYGMALHALHGSPAAAIAFYDPRLGAVVVASHNVEFKPELVVDVKLN
jgi:CRISPR-associated protein Csx3